MDCQGLDSSIELVFRCTDGYMEFHNRCSNHIAGCSGNLYKFPAETIHEVITSGD